METHRTLDFNNPTAVKTAIDDWLRAIETVEEIVEPGSQVALLEPLSLSVTTYGTILEEVE